MRGDGLTLRKLLCGVGLHKSVDIETQRTKHICFGFAGAELPGYRLVRKCKFCGFVDYMKLNLAMPTKYLYEHSIWKEV